MSDPLHSAAAADKLGLNDVLQELEWWDTKIGRAMILTSGIFAATKEDAANDKMR